MVEATTRVLQPDAVVPIGRLAETLRDLAAEVVG
jgi:hypothetical protein